MFNNTHSTPFSRLPAAAKAGINAFLEKQMSEFKK
jgi:hypothetical protein